MTVAVFGGDTVPVMTVLSVVTVVTMLVTWWQCGDSDRGDVVSTVVSNGQW
jgi:hypothetical protein